jgi:UDP-N-acetylglucosamine acyltransferase
MPIHPTAIIDKSAEIAPSAEIGAYAIVERNVHIGAETRLYPHAYISEGTTLGRGCQIHPFAVVGHLPQDLKYKGETSFTQIGDNTVVREHATIHRGTMPGSTTIVGSRCYIMSTGHVGHNCVIGDDVIIANSGLVSGHVDVGNRAFVSGNVSIHQFVRIGELAMIGGGATVATDVPPFMTVIERNYVSGPNVVGLRRAGFASAERLELRQAYKTLYRSGLAPGVALEQVAQAVCTGPGQRLVAFLRAPSRRGVMRDRGAWSEAD